MASNRSDWTSNIFPVGRVRVFAWVITIVTHILLIAYLTKALAPRIEVKPSEPSATIIVEFISLPRELIASTPPDMAADKKMEMFRRRVPEQVTPTVAQPLSDKKSLMSYDIWRNQVAPRQAINKENSLIQDDRWSNQPTPSQTASESTTFKRDFIRRNPPPMPATTPRMQLTFKDASLVGRLVGLSTRTICRELKEALAAKPVNSASIIASMQEHNCYNQ